MAGKRRADGPASTRSGATSRTKGAGAKQPKTWRGRIKTAAKWLLIVTLVGALVAVAGFLYLYKTVDIPDPNSDFLTETSHVYYADGKSELGDFAIQKRDSIDYDEMPQTIKDAVVAAENQTFWTDSGIDPKGILRAAFSNAQGNATQGASTITQQYVKILYLTQERSWQRKVKEAILSLKVQRTLSKEEVLEGYLNTIYFGRGAYGIQAAAQAYFAKDAKDLDLRESAVLASVINNPSTFDPANGKQAKADLVERYDYVLNNMADLDDISADEAEQAEKKLPDFPDIEAEDTYAGQKGHVLTMVRDELERLGFSQQEIDGGGLQVTTTFTQKAMDAAEQGVLEARPDGFSDKELHIGAATVEPGTGAVRGIYGGQDYLQSQLNWAVEGGQAGSTFKPFAVAAGLESGYALKDTFEGDSPYVLPDGTDVENEGDTNYGSAVSLLRATEDSINTAFIDLTLSIPDGPQRIMDMAENMGLPPAEAPRSKKDRYGFPDSSPGLQANTGISLGSQTVSPVNMANAYATIANGGVENDPYVIEKVTDDNGKTLYEHEDNGQEATSSDVAADTSYALQQVVDSGTGTAAQGLGRDAAGKTGTATNDDGDVSSAWFVGYTPQLSTAVMYVRGEGNEALDGWLPSYFGGSYPAQTWTAIMRRDMEGLPIEAFPEPALLDGEAPQEGHSPSTAPPTTRPPNSPNGGDGGGSSFAPPPSTTPGDGGGDGGDGGGDGGFVPGGGGDGGDGDNGGGDGGDGGNGGNGGNGGDGGQGGGQGGPSTPDDGGLLGRTED